MRVILDDPAGGVPGSLDGGDVALAGPTSAWTGGASPYTQATDLVPDLVVPAGQLRRLFVVADMGSTPGGATFRLSLEPGSLTMSAPSGTPSSPGLPAASLVSTSVAPSGGPKVTGFARYADVNRNRQVDAGDTIVVPFNATVQVNSAVASDFALPVAGDTFGSGASVAAGPASNEVTITLGSGASIKTRQPFAAAKVTANAASGIDMASSPGANHVEAVGSGLDAEASTPIDIIPVFVDTTQGLTTAPTNAFGVGDFDRDGDLDLYIATNSTDKVWTNDGSGVFTMSGQNVETRNTRSVAVGDVDRNGTLDVVCGNHGNGDRVWLNDGFGAFTVTGQDLGTANTTSIALVDLDHDGGLD
ncbi:MAG: FG-GAP repeat domain-containing protein, partial [Planctomycetota bacterium]